MKLIVTSNPFSLCDKKEFTGDSIDDLLQEAFGGNCLPQNVKLFHKGVAINIVTPADVDYLRSINDEIVAYVAPQGFGVTALAISIGTGIVVALAAAWIAKRMAKGMNAPESPPSPNNYLADRQNTQRIGGRIPDMYGENWAVPDNIALPYNVMVNGDSYEHSYFCVGRGVFSCNSNDFLDDNTRIQDIGGATLEYFHPYNINNASVHDTPALRIGNPLAGTASQFAKFYVKRFDADHDLPAPDSIIESDEFTVAPNYTLLGNDIEFKQQFKMGDKVTIQEADKLISGNDDVTTYNVNGEYTVTSITDDRITLAPINSTIADWERLTTANDTANGKFVITNRSDTKWTPYVYTDFDDWGDLWVTLRADNGLYQPNAKGDMFKPIDIQVLGQLDFLLENGEVESTREMIFYAAGRGAKASDGTTYADSEYAYKSTSHQEAVDVPHLFDKAGYSKNKEVRMTAGSTFQIYSDHLMTGEELAVIPNEKRRIRIRFRRLSPTVKISVKSAGGNSTVEAIQDLRVLEVFRGNRISANDYRSDITTIYLSQKATRSALAIRNRKLKVKCERIIKFDFWNTQWLSTKNDPSVSIIDILTDHLIGRLSPDLINAGQIVQEVKAIKAYFGYMPTFNHTFDDDNVSSADMAQAVCDAIFSVAKRVDGKVVIDFEKGGATPVAIFNSHNIIPDSYQMNRTFGNPKDYSGVVAKYKSPRDGSEVTMRYMDYGYGEPLKLIGVSDYRQAYVHTTRRSAKQLYGNKTLEFIGGDESNIVSTGDVIAVVNQLQEGMQQGSITAISGDLVTLSDPISDMGNMVIHIQTTAGTVESIPCTFVNEHAVKLARLPIAGVSTSYNAVVKATYQLVKDAAKEFNLWLVLEKEPVGNGNNKLTCVKYDERYYENDRVVVPDEFREE